MVPEDDSESIPCYTLQVLLGQCDLSLELAEEDREWLHAPPIGRELI